MQVAREFAEEKHNCAVTNLIFAIQDDVFTLPHHEGIGNHLPFASILA
jgi:hypothetical protein